MLCPKCGHDQVSETECEACGIVFEKYYKAKEQREQSAQLIPPPPAPKTPGIQFSSQSYRFISIGLAILLCVFVFRIIAKKPDANIPETASKKVFSGITKQLYDFRTPKNDVEKWQMATVFIESPFGTGSGFFINDKCEIITNKHVVKYDEQDIKDARYQLELLEKTIELHESALEQARLMMSRLDNQELIDDMYTRIEAAEEKVEKMKAEYDKLSAVLEKIEFNPDSSEYNIFLIDESKHVVTDVQFSEAYDLALLRLDQDDCPCLTPGDTRNLEAGQHVYTIGNPHGLSYTVTSGIISGDRLYENTRYLQTDAPINPGNSGGPLIDDNGNVLGINTMTLAEADGIGFAIPIETALEEFGLLE
jgi:S1-C subfamily serine protease